MPSPWSWRSTTCQVATPYPHEACLEVGQNQLTDYHLAAQLLNMNRVESVFVQHEYGIFGGADGRHIVKLLEDLRRPVITTQHTILREPSTSQREVLCDLAPPIGW